LAHQVEAQMLAGFGADEAEVFRAMLARCLNNLVCGLSGVPK
jgi:DNA-binding MarR family transcriptional regulator